MIVRDIVEQYLRKHGYDGLVSPGAECGCDLDHLFACNVVCLSCLAGYKGASGDNDCDWAIYATREDAEASLEAHEWGAL